MRAKLILAEAATLHPDGTFSLLRGGITNVWGENTPVPLQAVLVIRIETTLGEGGKHGFDIKCMDVDGKQAAPPVKGAFQIPEKGIEQNLVLGFQLGFAHGEYKFVLRVDNHEQDSWPLRVSKEPPNPTAGAKS